MGGRAILVALLTLVSCNRGSAVLEYEVSSLRIATTPDVVIEGLVPSEAMGRAGPVSDLIFDSIHLQLAVVRSEGALVTLRPTQEDSDMKSLARALRFVGLRDVAVVGSTLKARFVSAERAGAFVESGLGGLATGPYLEIGVAMGRRRLLAPRGPAPLAEFVYASERVHWQLLTGGHVDVVPGLNSEEVALLDDFPNVRVISKELDAEHTLVVNPKRFSAETRDAIGRAFSSGKSAEVASLPTVLLIAGDRESLAQYRKLANRVWRATGVRPAVEIAPGAAFQQRLLSGDFAAVLAPMPKSRPVRYSSLTLIPVFGPKAEAAVAAKDWAVAEALIEPHVIVLEPLRSYAAHSTDWCGDVTPEPGSWRWISDLRRCEK